MLRSIIFISLLVSVSPTFAERVIEKFPNGKPKLAYVTDKEGKKHGTYAEYYENGKPKLRCSYLKGELHGAYVSYYENGRPHKSITYREGKISGQYMVRDENGQTLSDSVYADGAVIYPKSKNMLKAQLKMINSRKPSKNETKFTSRAHSDSVNLLNSYRAIVGIEFDVKLKDDYCELAQAGAELCNTIGRLDHTPKNPGLKEEVYKKGYTGTSRSNLSMGSAMQSTELATEGGVSIHL
jgi:hypothetical protein